MPVLKLSNVTTMVGAKRGGLNYDDNAWDNTDYRWGLYDHER